MICQKLIHPSDEFVDVVFPVSSITTFHIIFFFIPPRGALSLKGHRKLFASLK
jgi:hypothetical protein